MPQMDAYLESIDTFLKSLFYMIHNLDMQEQYIFKKPILLIDWLINKKMVYIFSMVLTIFYPHHINFPRLARRSYVIKQLTYTMSKLKSWILQQLSIKTTLRAEPLTWRMKQISSFWHRTVSCSKSTWDFITFLVCLLAVPIYHIFLKLSGLYISSQLEPMGKVKWRKSQKPRIFPVSFCAGAWFAIIMQPLRKTNFLLASESLLGLGILLFRSILSV